MSEQDLDGRRILVVEDEYLIADELRSALHEAGADVIGPAPDVPGAIALIDRHPIDGALLDINLRGATVFELADLLIERGVPFAFATGYDPWAIPDRFATVPRLEKPIRANQIAATLCPLIVCSTAGVHSPN